MIRPSTLAACFSILAAAGAAISQAPGLELDLSGTWRLEAGRSEVDDDASFAGLVAAGVPETLHVTHPANGTLVVESQVNESHARLYVPGRKTESPVFLGAAGSVTVTSRWEGNLLVGEGERTFSAGDAPDVSIRESFTLGPDDTLEITLRAGEIESRLSYRRIDSVGTCESWPSPCKTP